MARYVVKRLLYMIVIVIAAGFVGFTLMYVVPGSPAEIALGVGASPDVLAAKEAAWGLDQPYIVQLFNMYGEFLGISDRSFTSWQYGVNVMGELLSRLPRTLIIGIGGMVLNVIIGTWLGIFAATHVGKWQDSLTMVISMVFVAAPGFWVALMMVVLFSQKLGWLPATGIGSWKNYVMPIIAGSLGGIGINARQARSAMLEVIRSDFVTTARSKGQKERTVEYKHMLPNAMMPIITGVGGGLALVVAGSPVMEAVFNIPGIGVYMLSGVNARDYPVVFGCVVFFAAFTGIAMLIMDLCYAFLDPRIKAQYARKKVK